MIRELSPGIYKLPSNVRLSLFPGQRSAHLGSTNAEIDRAVREALVRSRHRIGRRSGDVADEVNIGSLRKSMTQGFRHLPLVEPA